MLEQNAGVGTVVLREDGILHARFDFDHDPSREEVTEFVEARNALTDGRSVPVIVEIVRIPYVERTIRAFFMDSLIPPVCRAVVSTDVTFRAMFKSFQMVDPSPTPTEFFATIDTAVEWIEGLTTGDRAGA